MIRVFLFGCLLLGVLAGEVFGQEDDSRNAYPVGFPGVIEEVQLPGTLLRAKNIESRDQPVVVRIVNSFALENGFRYDLEFYGLDPGVHNLIDYLEREDGSAADDLPPLEVEVVSSLPPGQIEPNTLQNQSSFFRNFYLPLIVAGGGVWLAGLMMILFWGRGKHKKLDPTRHRMTVAQRIRPLIEKAVAGELTPTERGELERTMVSFWQKRLRLDHMSPAEMMKHLRTVPESADLFEKLEHWLHRPDPQEDVDIASLMKPYQKMNMDEIE